MLVDQQHENTERSSFFLRGVVIVVGIAIMEKKSAVTGTTMWGPGLIANLVYNCNITRVYDTCNELVNGVYKPINITGGPHIE